MKQSTPPSPLPKHPHPPEPAMVLSSQELVEVRAAQRTFEGAYMRTALGQFSFALVILKIFTEEFYAIGALFAVYGFAVLLVAGYRRYQGNRQFFTTRDTRDLDLDLCMSTDTDTGMGADRRVQVRVRNKFKTSGDTVLLMTGVSLGAYVVLMVLTWRLVS
ncbi:hypothetical protein E4U13_000167 [Claviceps humidiphila]|uniref:DUF202 domain-containing protein n=1 Tax=Claviceps humidiphila TaxID=1294629 RepID=A0A9P7Q4I9_9HYPO|nr:hypothetical protein E4U13_000167 [Claviceps humidiphila]